VRIRAANAWVEDVRGTEPPPTQEAPPTLSEPAPSPGPPFTTSGYPIGRSSPGANAIPFRTIAFHRSFSGVSAGDTSPKIPSM
jgi:hypothetical protein